MNRSILGVSGRGRCIPDRGTDGGLGVQPPAPWFPWPLGDTVNQLPEAVAGLHEGPTGHHLTPGEGGTGVQMGSPMCWTSPPCG